MSCGVGQARAAAEDAAARASGLPRNRNTTSAVSTVIAARTHDNVAKASAEARARAARPRCV